METVDENREKENNQFFKELNYFRKKIDHVITLSTTSKVFFNWNFLAVDDRICESYIKRRTNIPFPLA